MTTPFADIIRNDLWKNNPVTVQILGICSTLAVTNSFMNTLIMGVGLTFVTAFSALTISCLRNVIPDRIRMMVQTLVIASYVVIVDIVLKAYVPNISRALGPYVGLIITNCIIMGRMEAFSSSHRPGIALLDGILSGIGYTWILLLIALVRELLGFGTIWGIEVMDPLMRIAGVTGGWIEWSFMVMAPGGFFMLAIVIWIMNSINARQMNPSDSAGGQ